MATIVASTSSNREGIRLMSGMMGAIAPGSTLSGTVGGGHSIVLDPNGARGRVKIVWS